MTMVTWLASGLRRAGRRLGRPLARLSDEKLLAQARAGRGSVASLVERHRPKLVRYLAQVLDDDSVQPERLVDAVFTDDAIASSLRIDDAPTPRALLYRLVHCRLVADAHDRGHQPPRAAGSYGRLLEALQSLPLDQRCALLLREGGG